MQELVAPAVTSRLIGAAAASWDQLLCKLSKLALDEDLIALAMGDTLLEMEERFGLEMALDAAEVVQLPGELVPQRMRVARCIPKDHPLRESLLNFPHLVVLSVLPEAEIDLWAARAQEHQWSAYRLEHEIEAAGGPTPFTRLQAMRRRIWPDGGDDSVAG